MWDDPRHMQLQAMKACYQFAVAVVDPSDRNIEALLRLLAPAILGQLSPAGQSRSELETAINRLGPDATKRRNALRQASRDRWYDIYDNSCIVRCDSVWGGIAPPLLKVLDEFRGSAERTEFRGKFDGRKKLTTTAVRYLKACVSLFQRIIASKRFTVKSKSAARGAWADLEEGARIAVEILEKERDRVAG